MQVVRAVLQRWKAISIVPGACGRCSELAVGVELDVGLGGQKVERSTRDRSGGARSLLQGS